MGRELLWSYLFIFPYVHLFYQYLSLRHGVYYSISLLSKCNFTFFSKKISTFQQKIFIISKLLCILFTKTPHERPAPRGKIFHEDLRRKYLEDTQKYFTLRGQKLRVPPPMWCVYNPSALELLNTTYVEQIQINQIFTLDHE